MVKHISRAAFAVFGASALLLGGGAVASASVAPPSGPAPAGTTVQQARDGTSGTPVDVAPEHRNSSTPATTTTTVVPAPVSSAHASALNLEFLDTCISCTAATAGAESSHGRATAIRLLGHDIAGGDSQSNGSNDGALFELPLNPLLNLALADWSTKSGAADVDTSHSTSRAALIDLALLGEKPADSLLTVSVLEAASHATYTEALSHGDADANGVHLTALHGELVIIVLHSQTSSDHAGSSYLVSINGNKIPTSDQEGNSDGIPIAIPGLLTITLLQVSATGGSAVVGTVTVPTTVGETAGVVTAQSQGAATVVPAAVTPVTGNVAAAAVTTPTTGAVSSVPSTGVNLGIGGLLLVLAGTTVTVAALRRRRAAC